MATFIFYFSWNRANLTIVCSKLTPGANQGLKWFYYIPQVLLRCKVNPEC